MTFKLIATHNPQELFNGDEPSELSETYETDDLNELVAALVRNGYKVIITEARR